MLDCHRGATSRFTITKGTRNTSGMRSVHLFRLDTAVNAVLGVGGTWLGARIREDEHHLSRSISLVPNLELKKAALQTLLPVCDYRSRDFVS